MGNFLFCALVVFVQMFLRMRLLENIHGIEAGLAKFRKNTSRCAGCEKCKLAWYLLSAINLGDPYKVVEINNLLTKMDVNLALSAYLSVYVRESMAWIGGGHWRFDGTDNTRATDLIRRWKLHLLQPSDLGALRTTSAKFPWMMEIVRASVFELKGDFDTAVQDYRRAYKLMPKWLPEATTVFEKMNELGRISAS